MFHYPSSLLPSHRFGRSGCRRTLQLAADCREAHELSQFVANSCKTPRPYSIERLGIFRLKNVQNPLPEPLYVGSRNLRSQVLGLVKRKPVVQIDEYAPGEQAKCGNSFSHSRDHQILEFWQRRSGKQLSLRSAREMQSNIEGLIGLLAKWDREDCAKSSSVDRLREQHVSAKG